MNYLKALDHIYANVKKYRELNADDGEGMMGCLQQISATLVYLEKERAEYHDKFERKKHELIISGESVNKAENAAYVEFPEIYLLRRVMDSAYEVCQAIRSQVSWIKTGLNG